MLELKALFAQSDRDTLPLLPSGGFGTLDATASAIFFSLSALTTKKPRAHHQQVAHVNRDIFHDSQDSPCKVVPIVSLLFLLLLAGFDLLVPEGAGDDEGFQLQGLVCRQCPVGPRQDDVARLVFRGGSPQLPLRYRLEGAPAADGRRR